MTITIEKQHNGYHTAHRDGVEIARIVGTTEVWVELLDPSFINGRQAVARFKYGKLKTSRAKWWVREICSRHSNPDIVELLKTTTPHELLLRYVTGAL